MNFRLLRRHPGDGDSDDDDDDGILIYLEQALSPASSTKKI